MLNTPLNVKRKLSDGCHLLVGQLAETQQPPTLVGGC